MQNIVRVGVGVIVRKDGKVLLSKRLSDHGKGTWGFPGGKLEYGESFEECVKREVAEETSLTVTNIHFGALTNNIFESGEHYITVYMVCDVKSGTPKVLEPEKMGKWRWFAWNKFPKPLFLPIQSLLKQKFNPFK